MCMFHLTDEFGCVGWVKEEVDKTKHCFYPLRDPWGCFNKHDGLFVRVMAHSAMDK